MTCSRLLDLGIILNLRLAGKLFNANTLIDILKNDFGLPLNKSTSYIFYL